MYNSPNVFCTLDIFYSNHYNGMFATILTCMSYETHASIPYTFRRSQQVWFLNLLDLFPLCKLRSDPYFSANTVITNNPYFYMRKYFCIFKYFTFFCTTNVFNVMSMEYQQQVVIQARLDPFFPIDITLNTPSCSVEGFFAIVEIQ